MNIFAIDRDPIIAAMHLVDKHVSKMVLESAQMLANCFEPKHLEAIDCPRTQKGSVRKHSYFNHPCSIWVRTSKSNMRWLILHAQAMDDERMQRCKLKSTAEVLPHFSSSFINWCEVNIDSSNVSEGPLTEFAQAMPDEFKDKDSVVAYRNLYREGKSHLHYWQRNKPSWL